MTATPGAVVGRDSELAAVDSFLDRADAGFAALVVEGEAGIGKSTLWREGVRRAAERGFVVLACRASASETSLSHAAVADLLDGVPSAAWEFLPARQRHALDVVTFRAEPAEKPVEAGTIAAGLRSLIAACAEEAPVLLAIDDVQWLDEASVGALEHVVRRLWSKRVGLLVVRRLPEPARIDVDALVPADSLTRLRVEPLSFGALGYLLRDRLGTDFPRALLWRIHRAALGNPLFALEIGRTLAELGAAPDPDEPLPVPDDVRDLVRERVAVLPRATTTLLLGAALLDSPRVDVLQQLTQRDVEADLKVATTAGVAYRRGDEVAFAHPLHAAAIIGMASASERRRVHKRLADAVANPEMKANHLWFAADGPEKETADALERAAESALARGALLDAAEAFNRARQLTLPSAAALARSRGIRAADLYILSGDESAAVAVLDALSVVDELSPRDAARILHLRAEMLWKEGDLAAAEEVIDRALSRDPGYTRARMDQVILVGERGDHTRSLELAGRLIDELETHSGTDTQLLAEALAHTAMERFAAGDGIDWDQIGRAVELEDPERNALYVDPPHAILGYLTLFAGRYDEARRSLTAVRGELAERGVDDGFIQAWLTRLEVMCGNFMAAASYAEEGIAHTAINGNLGLHRMLLAQRAFVAVHLGDLGVADRLLAESAEGLDGGLVTTPTWRACAAAAAALSIGDHDSAWVACRDLVENVEVFGISEPGHFQFVPYAVEALVGTGRLDHATRLLDLWEERARALSFDWAIAVAARGRALLSLAEGDPEAATRQAKRAVELHTRTGMKFERARDLLVLGIAERRARRWGAARRALESAVAEFERLGTPLWAERARDELARAGSGSLILSGLLTPSEDRAARLAVDGHGNKEIAKLLSMSVHTVERHLSNAYRKLGISRRAELAAALRSRDADPGPPSS